MELIFFAFGAAVPLALLAFVGSYFGIWKRRSVTLSLPQKLQLFLGLWVLSGLLSLVFGAVLRGQDPSILSAGMLWGPLVVSVILGRMYVNRYKKQPLAD